MNISHSRAKATFLKWLPFGACVIMGIIAAALHPVVSATFRPLVYLQIPVCTAIPLIFPALERWAKIRVPYFINATIAFHIIISIDLGTALNAYGFIPHYDKFLHAFFGLWCAQLIYFFMLRWGGKNLSKTGICALVTLSVLGVAALWEVFEFTTDCIFDGDAQLWKYRVAHGLNPMTDTMMDIVVTLIGITVFLITLYIDHKKGGRLYGSSLDAAQEKTEGETEVSPEI